MPIFDLKTSNLSKLTILWPQKVNKIPIFTIFDDYLLLAPILIQKSINIKNGQLNFLDGEVAGGNLDSLREADEIDVAIRIYHFKLCRSINFHHYRKLTFTILLREHVSTNRWFYASHRREELNFI